MVRSKVKTELVTYVCPNCHTYNKPYLTSKRGIAFMLCGCGTQYKTSTKVSTNFRKMSSRQGRKHNRRPSYYSCSERALKRYLERKGFIEGLDFFHNSRVFSERLTTKGMKIYYWPDFLIPSKTLIVEVSPEIWHKLRGVPEKDKKKRKFFEGKGWTFVELKSRDIQLLNRAKQSSKRPKECMRLDKILKE